MTWGGRRTGSGRKSSFQDEKNQVDSVKVQATSAVGALRARIRELEEEVARLKRELAGPRVVIQHDPPVAPKRLEVAKRAMVSPAAKTPEGIGCAGPGRCARLGCPH